MALLEIWSLWSKPTTKPTKQVKDIYYFEEGSTSNSA